MFEFNPGNKFEQNFYLTQNVYNGFLQTFSDHNPLHSNDELAIRHGFKGKIMHGNILSGFLSFFIGECLPVKNLIIHTQEIQFKNPVYLNDLLKFEAEVVAVTASVNVVEFKFIFKNQDLKAVAKGKIQIGLLN